MRTSVGALLVATDEPESLDTNLPVLDINHTEMIADFIINNFLDGDYQAASG